MLIFFLDVPFKNSKVYFICLSKKGKPGEIMEVLLQDIKNAQKDGVVSFDPFSKRSCLIVPVLACVLADNPRAAELSSTNGHSAYSPCRFCLISKPHMKTG